MRSTIICIVPIVASRCYKLMRRGLKDGPGPSSCPTEDIATELTETAANVGGEPRLINPENVARFSSFGRAVEVTLNAGRSVMKCCTQKWDLSHYCEVVNSCFLLQDLWCCHSTAAFSFKKAVSATGQSLMERCGCLGRFAVIQVRMWLLYIKLGQFN